MTDETPSVTTPDQHPTTQTPSTRDRILIAAATMIGENPAARLSVRAVAARAEVSVGSLRHFFPDQRALLDEVLERMFRLVMPDGDIDDASLPAAERLVTGLRRILDRAGVGEAARELWRTTLRTYVDAAPSANAVESYLALESSGRRRIESWLAALAEEGALLDGDREAQARFLATLVNGLAVERALPMDAAAAAAEATTLRLAVSAVVRAH
ncbi:TetR/AcrR family transcriptional regulator [Microcella daejeonensis]|uniref:TetR/AcrR family transcriptional regulator n=1 Tax=Microcella daejeonensis TaxID=2994971 RepID=UPI00226D8CD5|nr:TetR/AcrR family transcriptional regulator [Microcella daejeonensis]WAB84681.1 TetR/AcrR family transcriptional regulator [Microcella daejeonensis]